MGSSGVTCEIVEANDESNFIHSSDGSSVQSFKLTVDDADGKYRCYPANDDLNQLIKNIDLRMSPRVVSSSRQIGAVTARKSALKQPVKDGIYQTPGIGISESVTLKQALRRLCISQASEIAAMKRSSKPSSVSSVPEMGAIKKLHASLVVQHSDSSFPLDERIDNLVEISVVPPKNAISSSEKANELLKSQNSESSNKFVVPSPQCTVLTKAGATKTSIQDMIRNESSDSEECSSTSRWVGKKYRAISKTGSGIAVESGKSNTSPRMVKAVFRHKASLKKKGKRELNSSPNISAKYGEVNRVGTFPCKGKVVFQKRPCSPTSRSTTPVDEIGKKNNDSSGTKLDLTPNNSNGVRAVGEKMSESSRSREKGECSQSSKSSIGDYSSSTSISSESHQSGSSGNHSRPHMSKDVRWIAIRYILIKHGSLGLKNFRLLKKLGCGDIGTVYLAELIGSDYLFALKVMDIEYLMSRKKMLRAQTEREILQMLDHPFLPTLYVHFTTDNLLCLVMEYCPGGDLHVLRQKQPGRSFSEPAARFYVAEVLLALEYLHMLGVVYRDLKPENILVREDGHIMLSDFDLSLRCSVSPTLLTSSVSDTQEPVKKLAGPCAENSCIDPLCLQPSWAQASCFSPRLVSSSAAKNRKLKSDMIDKAKPLPQLVVEPTDARSNSFVGTHEYLAPEIIRGDGHGSAVDWWTFGIFLYELLFGRTPFKGPGNEETLANVVSQSLKFPENPPVSFHARDLIRGLLVKEPENRLGSVRGAAEIKQHQFFEGLNWALIRCAAPPDTLRCYDVATPVAPLKKKEGKCLDFRTNGEDIEFELF